MARKEELNIEFNYTVMRDWNTYKTPVIDFSENPWVKTGIKDT